MYPEIQMVGKKNYGYRENGAGEGCIRAHTPQLSYPGPPLLRWILSTIHLGLRVFRFCIFVDRNVSHWDVLIKP